MYWNLIIIFKLDLSKVRYSEILTANLANCYRILLAKSHFFYSHWLLGLMGITCTSSAFYFKCPWSGYKYTCTCILFLFNWSTRNFFVCVNQYICLKILFFPNCKLCRPIHYRSNMFQPTWHTLVKCNNSLCYYNYQVNVYMTTYIHVYVCQNCDTNIPNSLWSLHFDLLSSLSPSPSLSVWLIYNMVVKKG